jgi:ABC-type nitrate/sulfonate/bicarbonate transport system permease component
LKKSGSELAADRAVDGDGAANVSAAEEIRAGKRSGRLRRRAYGASTFVVVLVGWYLVTARGLVHPTLLPPPAEVLDTFIEMVQSGELFRHIAISLRRIVIGFTCGVATAVPLGLLIARVRVVRDIVEPIMETIRPVPALAFLPLAILWFGIGEESKVFLLWFGTFFVIIISVIEGVYNFDVNILRTARNLEASELQIFWYVLLPGVLPFILQGMRQAIADCFRVIVAAEMIAAELGIGFLILHSSLFYRSDKVFVGIITLGVLGMTADKLVSYFIRNYFLRYRRGEEVSI